MGVKSRLIRNVIGSVVVLGLLILLYCFLVRWEPEEKETGDGDANDIVLLAVEMDNISEVKIKNENADYSIKRSDDDTAWCIPQYPNIDFSNVLLDNAVWEFSKIMAYTTVGSASAELSAFGLDGERSITVCEKDGTEQTLLLGDPLAVDTGYYIMQKGGDTIYTITGRRAEAMRRTPNDYRERTIGTMDASQVVRLLVTRGGERFLEIARMEENAADVFSVAAMRMVYPYTEPVKNDAVHTILAHLADIEAVDFVSENRADDPAYGLDNGYQLTVFEEQETVHKITFGARAGEHTVYATYNDKPFIFTMETDLLEVLEATKPLDLIEKFIHIYAIETVERIVLSYAGDTYTATADYSGEQPTYRCNGKVLDEKAYKQMFQEMISICFTDYVAEGHIGEKIGSITFYFNDKTTRRTEYYAYDERNVSAVRPQGGKVLTLRKNLENLIKAIQATAQ